ncbi:MAG: endolytic transglycosylase MltG [Bacteroidales bacterium]|jgi:UPF0755 protein|nr:endolytic transglycosylase MltG [Bacteroidales bacterium]
MKKVLIFLLVTGALAGWLFYQIYYAGNTRTPGGKTGYLLVPRGAGFEQLVDSLKINEYLKHEAFFRWAARHEKLPGNIHPGRYAIEPGMNNKALARKLAMGWQDPLNLTFSGTIRTFEKLAAVISRRLEIDSASMLMCLRNDSLIRIFGFDSVSLRGMFIPNTYEVFWNVSGEELLERMHNEYEKFWNKDRLDKASKIGLTPNQVSTLASIVHEETKKTDEMPVVAGVYMNRLRTGMPLQADPTLIFAARDYSIRRVLKSHMRIESPYNTYKYKGLPPGPISIPPIEALDAVLNYTRHNYIYFCAREDFSGYHNFASNLKDHNRNAHKFQQALNRMNQKKSLGK